MLIIYIDIDECFTSSDLCASNATCTNTEGGYNCSCDIGYHGDGLTCNSEPHSNLVSNANIISDVVDTDECFEGRDTCHSNAACMDTDGSFECTCENGFTGDGYNCSGKSYLCVIS